MPSEPESVVSIPRGARGELQILLQRSQSGTGYAGLQHVGADGTVGRGSTIQISELPAVIAALRAIHVREISRARPPVQQSLPESGPSEQTRAEMELF